jgi:hypothetical protein
MITQEQQDALERWRLKRAEIERFIASEFSIPDITMITNQYHLSLPDLLIIANAFDDLLEQNKNLEEKLARMSNENKNS